jgi:phenylacetaldehyde dehydrogenase
VTLELGGKSAMVAFEDAEIERIVEATQQSIFFNTGQVCSAGSRLYVQRGIYDKVITAVAERARVMKIGVTLDPDTEMGPAVSAGQRQTVTDYIRRGLEEGARLVCGGLPDEGEGYFVKPTLFADCHNGMRIVQEEIFGPVLAVIPFDTEEEAIRLANDNVYGLTASVFTRDISRAHRCVRKLEAGTVWVNTHDVIDSNMPFGGRKQSGIGKDMGPEQLELYLETKSVWIAL